jgi:uncharacterized membrane protein YeaQ/YmgE (transglycosylase-associated protein family)
MQIASAWSSSRFQSWHTTSWSGKIFPFHFEKGIVMTVLWWILVGLIAGWATGKIMGGAGYGPLQDIVVGIVGAIIGGFIVTRLGMAPSGGMIYTILVAILGAVVLTLLVRIITGRRAAWNGTLGYSCSAQVSEFRRDVVFAKAIYIFCRLLFSAEVGLREQDEDNHSVELGAARHGFWIIESARQIAIFN